MEKADWPFHHRPVCGAPQPRFQRDPGFQGLMPQPSLGQSRCYPGPTDTGHTDSETCYVPGRLSGPSRTPRHRQADAPASVRSANAELAKDHPPSMAVLHS